MPTYVVSGRVIPERTTFGWPVMRMTVQYGEMSAQVYFCVLMSQIIMHVTTEVDVATSDLRNLCHAIAADLINAVGFFQVRAFAHDIESVTCLDTGHSEVFGVEGYVFDSLGPLADRITFQRPIDEAGVTIPLNVIQDPFFNRATFELHSAMRYVGYTALHCRLAIEAIRNAFGPDEQSAWSDLRRILNVSRDSIESFRPAAADQRHGRDIEQSWEDRRNAMQVAWEIVNRYQAYVSLGRPEVLPNAPLL